MIYGNCIGGVGLERTYIIQDVNGNEVVAVMSENKPTFDATANDIRLGKVAVTDEGIITGEKEIPVYYVTEGYQLITSTSKFRIPFVNNRYDFTKLQAIICPYVNSVAGSVAAEKVAIGESVYAVNSTESLAEVLRDDENKVIDLGISNDSTGLYILRYFTYREEY